jgi:hypothetical protein
MYRYLFNLSASVLDISQLVLALLICGKEQILCTNYFTRCKESHTITEIAKIARLTVPDTWMLNTYRYISSKNNKQT